MSEWQPIETAPRDGRDIQIYVRCTDEQFVGYWDKKDERFKFAPDRSLRDPSHWRSLLEPPESEQ